MDLQKGEILKDIKGMEGRYAITNQGRVWSYLKFGKKTGRWLIILLIVVKLK